MKNKLMRVTVCCLINRGRWKGCENMNADRERIFIYLNFLKKGGDYQILHNDTRTNLLNLITPEKRPKRLWYNPGFSRVKFNLSVVICSLDRNIQSCALKTDLHKQIRHSCSSFLALYKLLFLLKIRKYFTLVCFVEVHYTRTVFC